MDWQIITAIVAIISVYAVLHKQIESYFHYIKATNALKEGDYYDAVVEFGKTLRLNPKYKIVYYPRGLAHFHLGNHLNSVNNFNKALEYKN
ncbi:MAG: hypothetical protein ACK4IX_18535, partial [Candidatus Sericytochromatia bacterium]